MDRRAKEKAAERKKASAKSRKSTDRVQEAKEVKKRGRLSTRSKVESDEEEPERSPVQPIAKKQKKEKAQASVKVKEPEHEERVQVPEFTSMDKYMHLDSWDSLVERVETIERDEDRLWLYGVLYVLRWTSIPAHANTIPLKDNRGHFQVGVNHSEH